MKFPQYNMILDYHTILIASYLLLIPFGRLSNISIALMFLLGIRLLFLQKVDFKQPKFLYFSLVFLCFWVPILCSMPDAINMAKTASVAGFYSSYFFAGLYIIYTLNNNSIRQKNLLKICTIIIVFWIIDALFQAVVGCDFFGFESAPGALNGIFGENHHQFFRLYFLYCQ